MLHQPRWQWVQHGGLQERIRSGVQHLNEAVASGAARILPSPGRVSGGWEGGDDLTDTSCQLALSQEKPLFGKVEFLDLGS